MIFEPSVMSTRFDVIVIGSGFGGRHHCAPARGKGHARARTRARPPVGAARLPEETRRRLDLQRQTSRRVTTAGWTCASSGAWPSRRRAGVGGGSLSYSSVAVEASPDVFTNGLARGDHVRRAEAVLRQGRPGDEPAGRSRRPADPALQARPRGGAKSRLYRSILEGPVVRQFFGGLELRARGPVQSQALPAVRQRARAEAGDVHPSWQLRHRLRRAGEEQPRRQLHPASRTAWRRSAAAASGSLHRAPGAASTGSCSIASRAGG